MRPERWICGLTAGMLLAGFAAPSAAQVPPLTCQANAGVPPFAAAEGYAELLGDFILICTGGVPTEAGSSVPPVDISLSLNSNLTSRELEAIPGGGHFSEALLLVDEPNTLSSGHGILNCGQTGAPDTGPSGPGVCSIVNTGNPSQSLETISFAPFFSVATAGQPSAVLPAPRFVTTP